MPSYYAYVLDLLDRENKRRRSLSPAKPQVPVKANEDVQCERKLTVEEAFANIVASSKGI